MTPQLERILRFRGRLFGSWSGSVTWKLHCYQPYTCVQPGIQCWWHQSQEKNDKFLLGCFSTTIWQSWFTPTGDIQDTSRFDWRSALPFLFRSSGFAQELLPVRNVCLSVLTVSNWTKLPQLFHVVLYWNGKRHFCVICWTSQPEGMIHKIELVPAGFVPRLAPIAFGECQFSS